MVMINIECSIENEPAVKRTVTLDPAASDSVRVLMAFIEKNFPNISLSGPQCPWSLQYVNDFGVYIFIRHGEQPEATLSAQGISQNGLVLIKRSNLPSNTGSAQRHVDPAVNRLLSLFEDGAPIRSEDDPEIQKIMYERIQQKAIDENLMTALEYIPEAFGSIQMLFVEIIINGEKVKALVDSGAQITIMSKAVAQRCGLEYLIDKRRKGIAKGVGTQQILGRVHVATVNLCGLFLPFTIDVLEDSSIEFIMGLDQLRRHQVIIDLKDNCLRVHDKSIPFLSAELIREKEENSGVDVESSPKSHQVPPPKAGEDEKKEAKSDHPDPSLATSAASDAEKTVAKTEQTPLKESGGSPTPPNPVPNPSAREKAISIFIDTTNSSREIAEELLEAVGWSLEDALSVFFESF